MSDATNVLGPTAYLVDVMMDVLARNGGCNGMTLLCAARGTGALELGTLLLQTGLNGSSIAMMHLAVFYWDDIVLVLFGEYFAVLDWLNGRVEMVLMNFTIDGGLSLFMTVLGHCFLSDSRRDLFMNGGIMVSSLVPDS